MVSVVRQQADMVESSKQDGGKYQLEGRRQQDNGRQHDVGRMVTCRQYGGMQAGRWHSGKTVHAGRTVACRQDGGMQAGRWHAGRTVACKQDGQDGGNHHNAR